MKKVIMGWLAIFVGICVLLGQTWAQAQPKTSAVDYPTKPIQVIVPSAAGAVIER